MKKVVKGKRFVGKNRYLTKTELKCLNNRMNGDLSDATGIYASRVKPKLLELLDFWFPLKNELKRVVRGVRRSKEK